MIHFDHYYEKNKIMKVLENVYNKKTKRTFRSTEYFTIFLLFVLLRRSEEVKENEEEKLVKQHGSFCRFSTVNRRRSTDNFVNDIASPVPLWSSFFSTMFFP